MDYKGRKEWLFGAIPIVYASNETSWAVDIKSRLGNKAVTLIAVSLLKACSLANLGAIVSPRDVKPVLPKRVYF